MIIRWTAAALLTAITAVFAASASNETMGLLLYPRQDAEPSSADCDALIATSQPSREKAEAWLSGRAPFGSDLEFYLLISGSRMETTFAAEGDYDTGTVKFGPADGDQTPFELVPDDHPDLVLQGAIVSAPGSPVVTVILRDVPSTSGASDRITYYCRFNEGTVT